MVMYSGQDRLAPLVWLQGGMAAEGRGWMGPGCDTRGLATGRTGYGSESSQIPCFGTPTFPSNPSRLERQLFITSLPEVPE